MNRTSCWPRWRRCSILDPNLNPAGEHWGKNLIRLLEEIGPIELIYPEIEDPVEWVKKLREDERKRRLGDWGEGVSQEHPVE